MYFTLLGLQSKSSLEPNPSPNPNLYPATPLTLRSLYQAQPFVGWQDHQQCSPEQPKWTVAACSEAAGGCLIACIALWIALWMWAWLGKLRVRGLLPACPAMAK